MTARSVGALLEKGHSNGAPAKKAILLVDDHPVFRKGMMQLLATEPHLQVAAEAENSEGALDAIRSGTFDLVVLDIGLQGGTNGIELTKIIRAKQPDLPVLIVSMHEEVAYAERALRAGASGYVMKRDALDSILPAVREVINEGYYMSPRIAKRMLRDSIHGGDDAVERLTARELEVFRLLGQGLDPQDIANELNVSRKTVEAHRANIKEKFGAASARHLVRYATHWVQDQRADPFDNSRSVRADD